jgi:hypothetical protein
MVESPVLADIGEGQITTVAVGEILLRFFGSVFVVIPFGLSNLVRFLESDVGVIEVTYLDSNWDKQTIDLTLTGNTVVNGTTAIRVLRAKVKTFGILPNEPVGSVYIYENGSAVTTGTPTDLEDVFVQIQSGEGVSHSLVISTARNEMFILKGIETSSYDNSDFKLTLWQRPFGKNVVRMIKAPFERNSSLKLVGDAKVGEKTDFWLSAECTTTGAELMIKTRGYCKKIE